MERAQSIPERIVLPAEWGFLFVPYARLKVWYKLHCPDSRLVNRQCPGRFVVTPDSDAKGMSLSVWVHESVPDGFEDIVVYHEIVEDRQQMNEVLAHRVAAKASNAYAKKHLTKEEYQVFREWMRSIRI